MFLRPAKKSDHDAVLNLAKQAGFGMTSLPPDVEVLAEKIAKSEEAFAAQPDENKEHGFFFVLEDPEKEGHIAGTCGIKSRIGLSQPFYSYKLTTITQASQQLDIFSKHVMLQVTNDLTGCSEIGALFLQPEYRRDRIGKLLSLSRFMFIAANKQYIADQVIAEMRGVHDKDGNAPFYESLAEHFFQMPFAKADYINATQGNQFINDLMPKYPIYLSLLPKDAQAVVGEPNPASEPAKVMLERQGFKQSGYVDIFDGGPTMIVDRDHIKAIKQSRLVVIEDMQEMSENDDRMIVSNDKFADFRSSMGRIRDLGDDKVVISTRLQSRLGVNPGDTVRILPI